MPTLPITCRFPLHWGEMDSLGHANNTRFFTWFESARIAYFDRVKLFDLLGPGAGPILATTTCDFLRPVVYPAMLEVSATVEKIGRTSLSHRYELRVEGQSEPAARGSSVVVLVRYVSGEKLAVPDALRTAIEALEGGPR